MREKSKYAMTACMIGIMMCVASCSTCASKSLSHPLRGDIAERIPLSSFIVGTDKVPMPGDIVVVNPDGLIEKCLSPNSKYVMGIVSTKPAHVLRGMIQDSVPIALNGVVPCNVSDEQGMIKPGDMIVSSSQPGYGMKAPYMLQPGTVVAKALEPQVESSDTILVIVMLR